jgi:hypothetical protein
MPLAIRGMHGESIGNESFCRKNEKIVEIKVYFKYNECKQKFSN